MPLENFSRPVSRWFERTFSAPTEAQRQGWPAIADGDHTLILAPTGSGKTLAAFLWALDRLARQPTADDDRHVSVVYVSPLRALAVDIEKNLRAPMHGIGMAADHLGVPTSAPTGGIRTGDTSADERRRLVRHPPDILITTPESLYLMLTSRARETLTRVDTVIVDEIHAVAATKRGAHLAVTLERLEEITERPPQRIGLSATQRPLDEIARFLGGYAPDPADPERRLPRPVTVVDAGSRKELDVEVVVPVDDMGDLGEVIDEPTAGPAAAGPVRRSIWPAMHPRLLELIRDHRSTILFVNSRRLAERLATRLNELALEGENRADEADGRAPGQGTELVMAHHGSLSRERRLQIEDELKSGRIRGLVATSSLELGIDMGAVDLVIQVESPGSVARGIQRIGRAGHQVGEPSRGRIFPKHRSDLVEAAVVLRRMREGLIEETRYPRSPLDVLAQQIVAMCALDDWSVEGLASVVRRAANFSELSDSVLESVLDLLSGRYPSDEFAELRPRIVWDRIEGRVRGLAGTQRLAVTSGGTIPDRGLFGVFLPDGTRVGEVDEEMVYESRVGETFLLGASTWRIEEIRFDRVVVTPAPGVPGKMPFWRGDSPGRPLELGRAVGAFVRELRSEEPAAAAERLHRDDGLDAKAATNLVQYLADQAEATGVVPDDRTIVVERFRDEIGYWRVCVLSPFGNKVHAPWAMALQARLSERWGVEVEMLWSDDGIVLRLPEAVDELPVDDLAIDPDEINDLVVAQLPGTSMFASRFRECAARALLLPRRRPDQRTPLWQQRQRAADLLEVAARYPSFPILLETTRECVNDVFDLPALRQVLADIRSRRVRIVPVDTPRSSPFAQSLLFGWIAVYMYEGDAPLAERRATALALDRDLLRELLGAEELRELIDPEVLDALELELQHLGGRLARNVDELADLLRELGPLTESELAVRTDEAALVTTSDADLSTTLGRTVEERRIILVGVAGDDRYAAAEDAARLRDALGVALPAGLPTAFTEPAATPLDDLVSRFARTHGPFLAAQVARRLGIGTDRVTEALRRLEASGRVVRGEFRPDGVAREWCDEGVLRKLRRRSLAALRREVEPVDAATLGRFLSEWHGIGGHRRGLDALVEVIGQLQGAPLPASVLEADVFRSRLSGYRAADLDALCTAGDVVWVGAGSVGPRDGRIRLLFRDQAALLVPSVDEPPDDPVHRALLQLLEDRGAVFWPDLVGAVADAGLSYEEGDVLGALWDLVWAGHVTNDSLAPVRGLVAGKPSRGRGGRGRPRPGGLSRLGPPAAAGRWSLAPTLLAVRASDTEAAHARAQQLLERYGVLTRETALGEGAEGGFAGVYPILKALEERGRVRRGYFVAGLGAAQFALPGAIDRLRACRRAAGNDAPSIAVLAATDPAQPYGAALPWPDTPGRPARAAGAYVALVDGDAAVYLERGGRSLVTFPAAVGGEWAEALAGLVKDGRLRRIEIAKIDGAATAESAATDDLRAAGFVDGYKGLTYRA